MPSNDSDTDEPDASPANMRTVDLSPTDTDGDDTTPNPDPEFDAAAEGKREATRKLQAADGATERDQLENAIADLRENFESLAQQRQQAQQRRQQLAQQQEQFEATQDHLQSLVDDEDDRLVMREWAGGITTEVPADDLPGLIEKVEDRHESLREESEQLGERLGKIERGVQKVQAALSELQERKEAFDTVEATKQDLNGSLR